MLPLLPRTIAPLPRPLLMKLLVMEYPEPLRARACAVVSGPSHAIKAPACKVLLTPNCASAELSSKRAEKPCRIPYTGVYNTAINVHRNWRACSWAAPTRGHSDEAVEGRG